MGTVGRIPAQRLSELQYAQYPPLEYLVDELIIDNPGIYVFAGRSKMGKSFAALNVGLAIATGGMAFSKLHCKQGEVLYYSLEDSARRQQGRLTPCEWLNKEGWPSSFVMRYDVPSMSDFEEDLETFKPRMVFVDTVGRIPFLPKNVFMDYQTGTGFFEPFIESARRHNCSIVFLHHTSKVQYDNPFDNILGTSALQGIMDGMFVLMKHGGAPRLFAISKDYAEWNAPMTFVESLQSWSLLDSGAAEAMAKIPYSYVEVLSVFERHKSRGSLDKPFIHGMLIAANPTKKPPISEDAVRKRLERMVADQYLEIDAIGLYKVKETVF